MMPLRIGKEGFSLPIELVTSTQAILARKRSGKSYTASVQAEELLRPPAAMDRGTRWSSSAETMQMLRSNRMPAECWRRLWSSTASRPSSM